jgi:hypothetical protein
MLFSLIKNITPIRTFIPSMMEITATLESKINLAALMILLSPTILLKS